MLEIKDVSTICNSTEDKITGPVSLQVAKGEICSVIGPSGCGKTSLLRALAGITAPYWGSIQIDGIELDPNKFTISYIPKDYGFLKFKTIKENCLFQLKIRGISYNNYYAERFDFLTQTLRIENLLEMYPMQLTMGQLQSAAIVRSLVVQPDLLLMDEPLSPLDSLTRESAQNILKQVLKEFNPTTLLVTHNIEEAIFLGNRVIVLAPATGKVIADITAMFNEDADRDSEKFNEISSIIRQLIKEELGERNNEKSHNIC